jgi:endonuclease/exonuclease/phosphatase (EEP) superfamily protein YafD
MEIILPKTIIRQILPMTTLLLCISTLVGFGGRLWWLFDVAGYFRVQFLLILPVFILMLLSHKRYVLAVLAGGCVLINLATLASLYPSPITSMPVTRPIRILSANLQEQPEALIHIKQVIEAQQPDLVLLAEFHPSAVEMMDALQLEYPFTSLKPHFAGAGIALYSRFPLIDLPEADFGIPERPVINTKVQTPQGELTLLGLHPYPPTATRLWASRNEQLQQAATWGAAQSGSLLLVGDLNIVPWSPLFQDILSEGGLANGRKGFGWQPTWPVRWPLVWLPFDHLLHSADITIHQFQTGPNIASDHFPILVDFSMTLP